MYDSFLFYGKEDNLRSAVPKTYFSVNDNDNFFVILGEMVTEIIDQ